MRPKISVIIITKNEAHDIEKCLLSVIWADEIIVLDSGSTDNTLSIAKQYTHNVYVSEDWQGFGIQKNRALAYATGDWVLSLDADERISPELRAEIEKAITEAKSSIYSMPRLSSFCGRFMKNSGWWPDRVVRLFKLGAAKFSDDLVHESLVFEDEVTQLKAPILHLTYKNLDEVVSKINYYSNLGAKNASLEGKKSSLFQAVLHAIWAFLRTYIVRRGFLDGEEGLMLAISNAEVTYYRYLKLYYLNKESAKK